MKCQHDHMLVMLLVVVFVVALFEAYQIGKQTFMPPMVNSFHDRRHSCDGNIAQLMNSFRATQLHNIHNINTTGKFIIYQSPSNTGLGNRIPPLISAALMALVVGRGLLVHWGAENISINTQQELMSMVSFTDLFDPPFAMDTGTVPEVLQLITTANTVRFTLQDDLAEYLLCHDLVDLYDDKRFIVWVGWRPFTDLILHNPTYADRILELGLSPRLVKAFAQCLFPPSLGVRSMLHDFASHYKAPRSQKVIGVHIRALSDHALSPQQQQNLWACVTSKYPPPPPNTPLSNASYRYFLASDAVTPMEHVPSEIKPYLMVQQGPEITRITKEGIQRALADIFLMGQAVEVFGVRRTTFVHAVQSMFEPPVNLYPFVTAHKFFCERMWEMPCFMNWGHSNYSFTCPNSLSGLTC